MIKLTFNNLDYFYKNHTYLINLIGLSKNYSKILKFLKKNCQFKKNIFIININRNKNLKKFKKIKSIKKKFKKKNLKII